MGRKHPTLAASYVVMHMWPRYVTERPPMGMPLVPALEVAARSFVSVTTNRSASTSTSAAAVLPKAVAPCMSVPSAATLNMGLLREAAEARNHIVTVYKHSAFHDKLIQHNLIDRFPLLTHYIEFGFPMSIKNPLSPRLTTFTPRHHPGAFLHTDFITDYLEDEESRGRISKPFPRLVLEAILGPFYASPLNVIEKARDPAFPDIPKWCLITNCSAKDHGVSLNDQLDADDYPTTWDGAERMAAIVSLLHISFYQSHNGAHLMWPCTCTSAEILPEAANPTWETTTVVEPGPLDSRPMDVLVMHVHFGVECSVIVITSCKLRCLSSFCARSQRVHRALKWQSAM